MRMKKTGKNSLEKGVHKIPNKGKIIFDDIGSSGLQREKNEHVADSECRQKKM